MLCACFFLWSVFFFLPLGMFRFCVTSSAFDVLLAFLVSLVTEIKHHLDSSDIDIKRGLIKKNP